LTPPPELASGMMPKSGSHLLEEHHAQVLESITFLRFDRLTKTQRDLLRPAARAGRFRFG
jgi:hypothetical protein